MAIQYDNLDDLNKIFSRDKVENIVLEVCNKYTNAFGNLEYRWPSDYKIDPSIILEYRNFRPKNFYTNLEEFLMNQKDIYNTWGLAEYFDNKRWDIVDDLSDVFAEKYNITLGTNLRCELYEQTTTFVGEDFNLVDICEKYESDAIDNSNTQTKKQEDMVK